MPSVQASASPQRVQAPWPASSGSRTVNFSVVLPIQKKHQLTRGYMLLQEKLCGCLANAVTPLP